VEDKTALWRSTIAAVRDDRYDIRIFELLPLYLKIAVIEQGVVVYSRDVLELYEYFYPFRRIWGGSEAPPDPAGKRCGRYSGGPEHKKGHSPGAK
jgi:hypothetical protein